MSTLVMTMVLIGAGDIQAPPEPPPPLQSIHFAPLPGLPPPERVIPLSVEVTSAPAPLRGAARPARRAAANLGAYFSEDDYPTRALREHHEGTVAFRLDVDPAGRVANCTVTGSSGSEALDGTTCRILRARPHYVPARMADGSAGADSVNGRVRWRLSETDGRAGVPVPVRPARLLNPAIERPTTADYPRDATRLPERGSGLRVAIGRAGRVIGCDVVGSSGSGLLDAAACPLYAARARFAPARNPTGAAVCDVARVTVYWADAESVEHRPRQSPREWAPASGPPRPLRMQLNAGLCPGWSPR